MKKIKFLIIICMVLLVGMIIALLCNQELKANNDLSEISISYKMDEDLILPKGLYKLGAVYDGRLTTEIICKSYNHLATEVIPKYYSKCKDLNTEELKKLYEKNKDIIYTELGYQNYKEFSDLINECKKLSGNKLVFESYELNGLSIEENNDSFSVYLSIKYKDNDEIIFNTYVLKKKKEDSTSIIFKTDVDLERLEEKQKELEKNTINNTNADSQNNTLEENIEIQKIPKSGKVI